LFSATQYFISIINELEKKPKNGMSSCKKDLCDLFSQLDQNQFIEIGADLKASKNGILKKIRFPNSQKSIGKRGGNRLIALLLTQTNEFIFLYVYPKTGRFGKDNVNDKELAFFLQNYLSDRENGKLIFLGNQNDLKL